jgi:Zn ribbon nucleic-acid-binding protein
MWNLKSYLRCGGDMYLDIEDTLNFEECFFCIQCGFRENKNERNKNKNVSESNKKNNAGITCSNNVNCVCSRVC